MHSKETSRSTNRSGSQSPDRLTRMLVVASLVLVVVIAILILDLCSAGRADSRATQTAEAGDATFSPGSAAGITPSPVPVTPPPCTAPADWVVHTIQAGDTLYSLAQRYGTDVDALKQVNCLQTDIIVIDQDLYVPGPPATHATAVAAVESGQLNPAADVQFEFPERYVNIVLLGSDKRESGGAWRTDTMIVVSLDTEQRIVRLLSIPRDLWVYIPGHGYDRINTADLWGELAQKGGGAETIRQTLYQNLGIPIHYYVRVDFEGFKRIIDALGGVDIDVECELTDIELTPGRHHMNGTQALWYARSRITTNDFDRSRRQRKILMALWQQHLNKEIILKLPALWSALIDTVQTDLPLDQVISLAYLGLQLDPSRIYSQSIGPWQVENWTTPEGAAVLLPNYDAIQELLNSFYGEIDWAFVEKVNRTDVEVLNGTWQDQAAHLASTSLAWAGFQIAGTGMADRQDYAETQIIVYNADQDTAELVAQLVDAPPTAVQYQTDPSSPVAIRVILGADFDPCAAE